MRHAGYMTDTASPTAETEDSTAAVNANVDDAAQNGTSRRRRTARLFPAMSFAEALFLGNAIQTHGAGQEIRRLTLFEALNRSPEGGTTRKLITSSGQYGITTGAYNAEFLALTPTGAIATDPDYAEGAKLKARFDLAIGNVAPFNSIYEKYKGNRLPTVEVLRDAAREANVSEELVAECVETFLANARELGLIRTIAGSEHLMPIEGVLERVSDDTEPENEQPQDFEETSLSPAITTPTPKPAKKSATKGALNKVCFVISPIGSTDSVERKHANLVLSALIEPALADLELEVVRADGISKPGLITGQVIDHIANAALVIADLSFANPNVYYELALRHAVRKPVVQLIRTGDKLPFDVGQYRTVEIDMTDIYVLVPQLDLHRQEITRQARAAMADGGSTESPLSQFYPTFWDHINHPEA